VISARGPRITVNVIVLNFLPGSDRAKSQPFRPCLFIRLHTSTFREFPKRGSVRFFGFETFGTSETERSGETAGTGLVFVLLERSTEVELLERFERASVCLSPAPCAIFHR
jgi:hypothetical protein